MNNDDSSPVFAGSEASEASRIVMHVDMDCFYAACERLRHPKLENEPVIIGMQYEEESNDGVVATASYEARDFGIHSTQSISEAIERLPRDEGSYLPVDIEFYKTVSGDVKEILHDMADTVREVSIDEAYLDVSDQTTWKCADEYAQAIKNRVQQEIGVVASIGVAPNMSASKIASDHDKPDGLFVITPESLREFLAPLDIEEIHELGEETARELREQGIETAGDLAKTDQDWLEDRFGKRGGRIYRYATGKDHREVTPTDPPKSFLRDSALTDPTSNLEKKRSLARTLSEEVANRAEENGAMYKTIRIKVVTPPFDINRRSRSLSGHINDSNVVEQVALELLEEFRDTRVRKLGVSVSNLTYSGQQQQSGLEEWGEKDAKQLTPSTSPDSREVSNRDSDSQNGQASLSDF